MHAVCWHEGSVLGCVCVPSAATISQEDRDRATQHVRSELVKTLGMQPGDVEDLARGFEGFPLAGITPASTQLHAPGSDETRSSMTKEERRELWLRVMNLLLHAKESHAASCPVPRCRELRETKREVRQT
ncbi:hypothetical protein WJX72_001952 [[Myrmecia] bisecta]|uniref:Uncharacterized protein n=1 Tax=[Myrmecia] bisecta TaxID=41462 RepID=A0AAW1QQC3_9CHLO